MKVLCFDIGGTDIKYGIVEDEIIIDKSSMPTNYHLGQESISNRLLKVAQEYMKQHQIDGVGISCAGCVDFDNAKIIVGPERIKEFNDWDFKKLFSKIDLEVVADNDVNCFAVAEGMRGAAKNNNNFLTMTVGTGIGGAFVVHGKMWRGLTYKAAEFGRILINGEKYEHIAATSALVRMAKEENMPIENGKDVFRLYDLEDKTAKRVVEKFYNNLAQGIATLAYIFDPEVIVIGGGLSNRSTFAQELKTELRKMLDASFYDSLKIENAYYQNDGGMMGAYFNFVNRKH